MKRVKKTTVEQFNLLKSEMAVHPAAARGYGAGANRPLVDAEWKEIMEKLNALGPPYRTLTEWKKVWSDIRLRNKKRSMGLSPRRSLRKRVEPEEDILMENLNSSFSIYDSNVKTNHSNHSVHSYVETTNIPQSKEQNEDFNINNLNPDEEEQQYYNSNSLYNEGCEQTIYEINSLDGNEKFADIQPTLNAIQTQLKEQHKLMSHLQQMTVNIVHLMERQILACERKTFLLDRQLKEKKIHNILLGRQQRRKKLNSLLT